MKGRMLTFGVVGTNFISDWFAEAVAQTDAATVGAVCSRSRDTGEAFAARHGISAVYGDLDSMLRDRAVDAVYIATPNYLHAPMIRACLLSDKHVLCEKPATQSARDFEELCALAKARGLVLLEAMRPDFDPAYAVLREALGRIGRLRRVALTFCQYSSRYDAFRAGEVRRAFDPSIGNCALADIGIYPLHIAVSLFGAPARTTGFSTFLANGFEGAGELLLDYTERGFTVSVTYSKIADSALPSVWEGEDGVLTVDKLTQPTRVELLRRADKASQVLYTATHNGNMVFEVDAFVAMTRGECSAQPYLTATRTTLSLMDAYMHEKGIVMPDVRV